LGKKSLAEFMNGDPALVATLWPLMKTDITTPDVTKLGPNTVYALLSKATFPPSIAKKSKISTDNFEII